MKNQDWSDFLAERQRKEDEAIKKRYAAFAHLGRGHLHRIGVFTEREVRERED
jgi:hypothetical protein